jgi:hypothetical protein
MKTHLKFYSYYRWTNKHDRSVISAFLQISIVNMLKLSNVQCNGIKLFSFTFGNAQYMTGSQKVPKIPLQIERDKIVHTL